MRVSMISDVVCPWCRIGKANLMTAADQWTRETGEPVQVQMLPFLLDPVEPGQKEGFRERLIRRKGMEEAQVQAMFDRVTQVGAQQGIRFDFDKVRIAVDTVPAHELMELASPPKRNALMDALMTAYFEQGRDVGEPDVLLEIARETGLTDAELSVIEPVLRTRKMEPEVRQLIAMAQQAGVQGVPFFIVDDVLAMSGAQPVEVFLQAFHQAKEMRSKQEEA